MMVAEMKNDSFLPARSPACPLLSSRSIAAIDVSSVRCWQVFIPIGGAWTSRGAHFVVQLIIFSGTPFSVSD